MRDESALAETEFSYWFRSTHGLASRAAAYSEDRRERSRIDDLVQYQYHEERESSQAADKEQTPSRL